MISWSDPPFRIPLRGTVTNPPLMLTSENNISVAPFMSSATDPRNATHSQSLSLKRRCPCNRISARESPRDIERSSARFPSAPSRVRASTECSAANVPLAARRPTLARNQMCAYRPCHPNRLATSRDHEHPCWLAAWLPGCLAAWLPASMHACIHPCTHPPTHLPTLSLTRPSIHPSV